MIKVSVRIACLVVAAALLSPACFSAPSADGLGSHSPISEKNLFDPERKAWPDKAPQAAPASSLSPADVQLYGVMIVGDYKRAILKLDGKLKHLAPGGDARPFVTLAEGQSLGEYTLVEVQPRGVVFSAGAARQPIAFSLKTDRPAPTPLPPVIQSAIVAPVEVPTVVPGLTPVAAPTPQAPVALPTQTASPMAGASAPGAQPSASANPGTSPSASTGQPAPVIQGATLADAIAAAQAAAASGTLPPTVGNPFAPRR